MVDTHKIKSEVERLCDDTIHWHHKRIYIDKNKEEFTIEMKSKYEYLFTNSPTLFERCIQGDLNMQQLNYMLAMIKKVNSGADYQTTSTEVGQHMVDIYVKPLLDNAENTHNS